MPDTIPAVPAHLPVDLFFDQVIQAVRRDETRAHLAEQLTGAPYVYDLSSTASFSGLPVPLLRSLCRDGEIQAIKLSGWWLVRRDEFNRLLSPEVTLRCRAARQYILVRNLQQLAAMLHRGAAGCTISVLLRDLRRAAALCGDSYDEAEGFAWRRAEWRVREGILDPDQTEEALRLVQAIIQLGMELFRNVNWRDRNSALLSMIAAQTGVELAV
jgi:hypothetical protein